MADRTLSPRMFAAAVAGLAAVIGAGGYWLHRKRRVRQQRIQAAVKTKRVKGLP